MNNRNLLTIAAVVTLGVLGGWWYLRPGGAMAPMEHMGGGVGLPNAMTSTAMDGIAEGAMIVDPVLPSQLGDQAQMGKRGFEAKCAACHGENAGGIKGTAPPLVHKIYELRTMPISPSCGQCKMACARITGRLAIWRPWRG